MELTEKLSRKESDSTNTVSKLQDTIQGLKERFQILESEKERALRDKGNLLDEVSVRRTIGNKCYIRSISFIKTMHNSRKQ